MDRLLGIAALAQNPQAAPAQRSDDALSTTAGEHLIGRLVAIDPAGQVRFQVAGQERAVALDLCETITRSNTRGVERARKPTQLWLSSGASLDVRLAGGKGNELLIETQFVAGQVPLPLRHVKGFCTAAGRDPDPGFAQALESPSNDRDLLFVTIGDKVKRLSVQVRGAEEGNLVVEFNGTESKKPLVDIYGMVFARDASTPPPRQPMPRILVELASGGMTFEGKLLALDDQTTRLRLDEGFELAIPTPAVLRLRVRSDKLVYLSDLKPVKVEQTPALDHTWPWLRDEAPGGRPITLMGREYQRGLVLVPKTRLVFAADGKFDAFRATIGIDDKSGPRAHAVFRVYGDDKLLLEVDDVTHATKPKELDVPMTGVRRLAIETDFGANLDFGDHCAFAAARLIKS